MVHPPFFFLDPGNPGFQKKLYNFSGIKASFFWDPGPPSFFLTLTFLNAKKRILNSFTGLPVAGFPLSLEALPQNRILSTHTFAYAQPRPRLAFLLHQLSPTRSLAPGSHFPYNNIQHWAMRNLLLGWSKLTWDSISELLITHANARPAAGGRSGPPSHFPKWI